jgi:hypothetical protein
MIRLRWQSARIRNPVTTARSIPAPPRRIAARYLASAAPAAAAQHKLPVPPSGVSGKVVVTNPAFPETLELLRSEPRISTLVSNDGPEPWPTEELLANAEGAVAMMCFMPDCVDAPFLEVRLGAGGSVITPRDAPYVLCRESIL